MITTVRIEIHQRSRVKYERTESGDIKVDRFLRSGSLVYSFDYGYITDTLGGDGDELDAVVISDRDLIPNCLIDCKVIGVLKTSDEKGEDDKVILVPAEHVDHKSVYYNDIEDIRDRLDDIRYFFRIYKETSKVERFGDRKEAEGIVKKARESKESQNG